MCDCVSVCGIKLCRIVELSIKFNRVILVCNKESIECEIKEGWN